MNNFQTHKSKNTNKLPNKISFETYFPNFASVELRFAFIKRSNMKICKVENVNLRIK